MSATYNSVKVQCNAAISQQSVARRRQMDYKESNKLNIFCQVAVARICQWVVVGTKRSNDDIRCEIPFSIQQSCRGKCCLPIIEDHEFHEYYSTNCSYTIFMSTFPASAKLSLVTVQVQKGNDFYLLPFTFPCWYPQQARQRLSYVLSLRTEPGLNITLNRHK